MSTSQILESIKIKGIDGTLDTIFNTIDELLTKDSIYEQDFAIQVDDMLNNLDIGLLPNDILIGILTITFMGTPQLEYRNMFFNEVKLKLLKTMGKPTVDNMLRGLSCVEYYENNR